MPANRGGDALSDLTRAIEIDPGNASAYVARGQAALYSGDSTQSIDDFLTAHRLLPTNPYTVLWLHIARTHRGEDDAKEFRDNSENLPRDAWPGALLGLYDGSVSPEQLRNMSVTNSWGHANHACDLDFYTGEYAAHHRSKVEAHRLLAQAQHECTPDQIGFIAIKGELELVKE